MTNGDHPCYQLHLFDDGVTLIEREPAPSAEPYNPWTDQDYLAQLDFYGKHANATQQI